MVLIGVGRPLQLIYFGAPRSIRNFLLLDLGSLVPLHEKLLIVSIFPFVENLGLNEVHILHLLVLILFFKGVVV